MNIYKNGRTVVCLSFGMWRANGNPNPFNDLDEILHPTSPPVQERFWCRFDTLPLGPGQPKTQKAEGNIFENCLKSKGCSAGCKLTRAGPSTSAYRQ